MDKKIFALSFFICVLIFVAHVIIVGSIVWGDGRYYFTIAQSLAFDQDFNFENQYSQFSISEIISETDLRVNKYPPGTSLVWLPFLFTLGILHCAFISNIPCNEVGYSLIYPLIAGVINIGIIFAGLYVLYVTLQKYYKKEISLYATLLTLFGTNILFYASFDPVNSHPPSFFFASLLLYILLVLKNSAKKWLLAGGVLGWIVLVRTLDGLLFIPALYFLFIENKKVINKAISFVFLLISFLLFFSIQIIFWYEIYGFIQSPYLTGVEGFSLLNPKITGVLLNKHTGLIIWTPFVFLGFLGLFKLKQTFKWLFITIILIAFYFIASWSSWDQGGSFGTRMLIAYLPIIGFGFAQIFKGKKWERYYKINPMYIILGAAAVNFLFIIVYLSTH